MKAILKKIEVPEYDKNMLRHPIKMFFTEAEENDELYRFVTSVETQFCTTNEYDVKEGISEELFDEKTKYINTLIGKIFEINLYKFTVKELTDNKYEAFNFSDSLYNDCILDTVEDYHIASYMTKEDVIQNLKYFITKQSIDRVVEGVLSDGSTEEITTETFFPKSISEKKIFEIPYENFPNLNAHYIIYNASLDEIRTGHNLAFEIKKREITENSFFESIKLIEEYRVRVRVIKEKNESLRKKIFFWQPKENLEDLKLNPEFISVAIDSIILSSLYPSDCFDALMRHADECAKRLGKEFMLEDKEEDDFKDKWLEFRQSLRKKYKGKETIPFLI